MAQFVAQQAGAMGSGAGDKKEEKKEDTDKTVLDASNAGYKMLSKMGWKPGKGLGAKEDGKVAPVGAAKAASDKSGAAAGSAHGVGSQHTWDLDGSEDVYEQYRKRMSQNPFWNVVATEMTSEGYPVRPGQGDCSFYMKTGQCKLGARCKWNHPHKGVSTFENVYLGTGACGAPNDLDAGACAAKHARAQWMVPYKQTSSQVERRVLESLSRGGTRCTCIRVSSILLSSRVELHSRSSPNKWRTHEALHAFFSNPANSFLSNPANSGKPQVLLPPAEPEAAYIAFDNYEHLRHFTRFRQQLIGGMRVRLEPVQRTQCPDGQWLTLCASPAAIAGATATPTGAADCSCPPPGRAAQQVDLSIYLSIYVCVCMCVCM